MSASIEVTAFADGRDACIDDQLFFHTGCPRNAMTFYRNPATNDTTLRCTCGLELVLFSRHAVESAIFRTAIDREPRRLVPGTFYCSAPGTMTVMATSPVAPSDYT